MKNLSIILLCVGLLQACVLNLPDSIAGYEKRSPVIEFDKYIVYSDYNGDGIINKGEGIELQVWLKNTGTREANGVYATFSTASMYVDYTFERSCYYGDIPEGTSTNGNYYDAISFIVSSSTPAGTQIPINISITDWSDNTWTESFTITVEATNAQIVYDKYSVYSDSNGDGIINKGETVGLEVWLKNTGTSTANGVYATFSTTSMYVDYIFEHSCYYGDIPEGTSTNGNYYDAIYFTVSSSAPAGTQIPINISITDWSGNTWTESFTVPVADIYTPSNAYSTDIWIFGSRIWSDRIVATPSNCTQTDNLSTSNEYKVYDGRYYYSWTCAYNNRDSFCPSPWRMPTQSDFSTLVNNTTYSALISAWGYGGYAIGSSMRNVSSYAHYWSSTEYDSSNAYELYYYSSFVSPQNYTYKYYGQQVRCVK
jgi:hypothetical protein